MKHTSIFAALASMALLAACVGEPFEEITEINLSRCLEPQKLGATVDAATGYNVTFKWDVNKDADSYTLVVGTDENFANSTSYDVLSSQVPYTVRLTADQEYYFKVQALSEQRQPSNWAVYDGTFKTYAVKDNLFLEVTGRTATSVSLAWSKDASDYKEVTKLTARPVKGGETVEVELTEVQATAAAATVSGLQSFTEYQITLFYMSASRGAVDVWTTTAPGTMAQVTSSEELVAAVTAGGEVFVALSGSPYTLGGSKPTGSVHLVGETGADGSMPVVLGNFDLSSPTLAAGSSFCLEGLVLDDQLTHNHLFNFSGGHVTIDKIEVVNCEITNYKAGLLYNNKSGAADNSLTIGELSFTSCDIHDMASTLSGDCIDVRKDTKTSITSIKFVNNTIYDGLRTFFRVDLNTDGTPCATYGTVTFENNTFKNVSTADHKDNRGIFAIRTPHTLVLKKNLFLHEWSEETATYKPQLFQDNTDTYVSEINASDNYAFMPGDVFFAKVSAADAGVTVLAEDPCYNSKGNYFQLADQDLIKAKVGAPKWWISYVEKEEDLTQNVLPGAHTWNLQDATLFAGDIKNSRVRDELLLVGTEATPLKADGGINFLGASALTKKGVPTEGYIAFKVNTPGSVDLLLADGGASSIVVAVADNSGFNVKGGSLSNSAVQKVVVDKLDGEGVVYLYSTGAISLKKLAWSLDTSAGNRVLPTPKPVVEPVTLTEGDAVDVNVTWDAVPNAASYVVIFNKKTYPAQAEQSFTVPAADVAALKAGLYNFTVQAFPSDIDIYYTKSELGAASVAIQPKASAGEQTVEVDLVWDFSNADWQAAFADKGASGTDLTEWDITVDGLQFYSKTKSKYAATYMQFGGSGIDGTTGDLVRYFKFTAPEQGTLKVTASNTGSSEALDRTVRVINGGENEDKPGGFSSSSPQAIEYSVKAGEVTITAPVNGLRFYKIEFHYSYTTGGTPAPIEYDWNFSNADWQAAFANKGASGTDLTEWDITVDGLQFYSKTKSKYAATYMQFGGAGVDGTTGDLVRYFKFTAPEQGTLKVTASNTGSSEALDRTVRVICGGENEDKPGGFSSSSPQAIEYSVKAGEVTITAPVNGLRFYSIYYINQ